MISNERIGELAREVFNYTKDSAVSEEQFCFIRRVAKAIRTALSESVAPEEPRSEPDGYAVLTQDGAYVGIWRERDIAEKIANRGKHSQNERIVAMRFTDDPSPPQSQSHKEE